LSPGATGWLAVGAVVVAAELLDSRTMSEAFREASKHPVAGPAVIATWAVLTAHLLGYIPAKYDPFTNAPRILGSWRRANVFYQETVD
jgi:hypothetical protein